MSLFNDESQPPHEPRQRPGRASFSLRNRSVYFWLNVGFAVVVAGLIFGASDQPWYIFVALAWIVLNLIIALRSGRNRPPPPNLFTD